MEKIHELISVFVEIGVPKETTVQILDELLLNSGKYAGKQEEINNLLVEKLTIDNLIALKNYIKI